ncbi:hypothetical protein [Bdellovibrio sp. HCB337]|uniref:hypothetical protein n=1 Tax=Bdellovibrio sp. HCB337 TaxID=3394358 RepID=UPI0039A70176
MRFIRIVSQDEWTDVSLTAKALEKLKILVWQDPATNDLLKAFSKERHICPVILAWRLRYR